MKKKLKISELHLKTLALFTNGFDKDYYIREVQRLLKVSSKTAFILLSELELQGILEAKTRGKIKQYKLREHAFVNDYLIMVEAYKKIAFLDKHDIIKEIVEKIMPYIDGIGIIFGSYVKGTQKKDSDLDVFIAGKYNRKEIDKISDLYNINVSVKNYPLNIFEKHLREDILIREILDNHVTFKGIEQFIEIVR